MAIAIQHPEGLPRNGLLAIQTEVLDKFYSALNALGVTVEDGPKAHCTEAGTPYVAYTVGGAKPEGGYLVYYGVDSCHIADEMIRCAKQLLADKKKLIWRTRPEFHYLEFDMMCESRIVTRGYPSFYFRAAAE